MYPFKWASYIFINTGKFVCVFSDVEFTCRYRCWSKYTWRSTWRFFKRWPCIKHLFAYLFLCGIRRTKVWKSILISIIISHFMLDVGLKGFLRWLLANGIRQLWYRVAESRVVYKSRLPVNFAGFSGRFCRLLSLFHESRYVEGMMFITSHNRLLSTKLGLLKNLTKTLILPPVSQTTLYLILKPFDLVPSDVQKVGGLLFLWLLTMWFHGYNALEGDYNYSRLPLPFKSTSLWTKTMVTSVWLA